jgi:purine-nucleoside phosphorylase
MQSRPAETDIPSPVAEAIAVLRRPGTRRPRIGIILGSGLGSFVDALSSEAVCAYADIPGFTSSTAPGHAGRAVMGLLEGTPVIALQGRCHAYEGRSSEELAFPVRVLHALGIELLIISCAAGGLSPELAVGDLLIFRDHVDLQFRSLHSRPAPRAGWISPYNGRLSQLARQMANNLSIRAHAGTYIAVAGPNYETRAELRWLRQIGDAVGMSAAPEAVAAHALGLPALAIATITNLCDPEHPRLADAEHVLAAASQSEPRFRRLIQELVRSLPANRETPTSRRV